MSDASYDCVAVLVPGPKLDGKSLYRVLEEFRCDSSSGVPTVFLNLLDYMATENKQLHYLKMLRIGGAACPAKIVTRFGRCSLLFMPLMTLFSFDQGAGSMPAFMPPGCSQSGSFPVLRCSDPAAKPCHRLLPTAALCVQILSISSFFSPVIELKATCNAKSL